MEFETVCRVSMSDHGLQVGRQVDDGDGIELEPKMSHF